MMTYTLLNFAFFIALTLLGLILLKGRFIKPKIKPLMTTLLIILACTAIFDSLIILLDIVAYDSSTLLGLYIWTAPIEDFSYAIVAAIGAPVLWHNLNLKQEKKSE